MKTLKLTTVSLWLKRAFANLESARYAFQTHGWEHVEGDLLAAIQVVERIRKQLKFWQQSGRFHLPQRHKSRAEKRKEQ